jgi:hypothetical protein
MSELSSHLKNSHATDRGCVEDQPQKRSISAGTSKLDAISNWSFLRLVSDTAAVQFLLPRPEGSTA